VTGFAPNTVTKLPEQPSELAYDDMSEMHLEIPSLSLNVPIVGVKLTKTGWDLTWLGNNAGYLEGSAYPTWSGNTVLTGHVLDEKNAPGAFAYIKDLKSGDLIFLHAYGMTYAYQVEESMLVKPYKVSDVFKHEDYNWLTLVTCESFSAKAENYLSRRVVRAILVGVLTDQ
jgi:LPXTG-site transpeptidase (sortase) family protein